MTLPAAQWVLAYHVLSASPTAKTTRWFAGAWVWYQPLLGQQAAAEFIGADDSQPVTIVVQGESAWWHIPAQHLTRQEVGIGYVSPPLLYLQVRAVMDIATTQGKRLGDPG